MLIRKKENKQSDKKSQLTLVGSLIIMIGLIILGIRIVPNFIQDKQEEQALSDFYIEQSITNAEDNEKQPIESQEMPVNKKSNSNKANYIAVLKIPKVGLEKGLYGKGSYYNNVNRNIQILDESTMPDQDKGNVILASHSGNGRTAYFKNLYKLQTNDMVILFYNGYEYRYRVTNTYDVEKNGSVNIVRNVEKNSLSLITCRHNTNKQIVIICELVEKV